MVGLSKKRRKHKYKQAAFAKWNREWDGHKEEAPCRQTKILFPERDAKKSREILDFGRSYASNLVFWISGHCNLMRHRHLKTGVDPRCRLCGEADETPDHLMHDCPALIQERMDCFGVPLGRNPNWTVKGLHKFITCSKVYPLITDETEY